MLLLLLGLLEASGVYFLGEFLGLEVVAGDAAVVSGDQEHVSGGGDVFEDQGISGPLGLLDPRTEFGVLGLEQGLQGDVAVVFLLLVIVDDDEIFVLGHRDEVLAPRAQGCHSALVLLGRSSDDLLALHVELLDGARYRSKRHNLWILLYYAHRRQLFEVLEDDDGALILEAQELQIVAASVDNLELFQGSVFLLLLEMRAKDFEASNWVILLDLSQVIVLLCLTWDVDSQPIVGAGGHDQAPL